MEKIKILFAVDALGLGWFMHDFDENTILDNIFDGTSLNDNLSDPYPEKVIPSEPGVYIGYIHFEDMSGWTSAGYEYDYEITLANVSKQKINTNEV